MSGGGLVCLRGSPLEISSGARHMCRAPEWDLLSLGRQDAVSDLHGRVIALADRLQDLAGPLAVAHHAELAGDRLQGQGLRPEGRHAGGQDDGVGVKRELLAVRVSAHNAVVMEV